MSVFNSVPPKINKNQLIKWLKDNYKIFRNINFSLKKLNSERDNNFLLTDNKNTHFVVKISNSLESKELLEMQDYVISSLSKRLSLKNIIPKKIHKSIKTYTDQNKSNCYVRILTFIKGEMYANCKHSQDLECSLGSVLGNLSKELQNLAHESSFRKFEWNPSSVDWLKTHLNLFKSKQRKIIKKNLKDYDKFVKKNINNLRFSLTHGDANNFNLVVNNKKIVGLLDYGDMIFAPTINDLAISLAYALMNKKDLYTSLKNIISTYHNNFSITFDEIYSLMTLVKCRLTITVVMAEKQKIKFPKNKYLVISQNDAWNLLEKLNKINPYLFIYMIRDFCGLKITKNYDDIINYLKENNFNKILKQDLNQINKSIINFNSDSFFHLKKIYNPKNITKKINTFLKSNNSKIGIGPYGEKRNIYKGSNYLSLLNQKISRDTHLGIDIFTNVNQEIFSPINGKVVILKNNSNKFDYGPTVVLEHNISKKIRFYTLYGHLSKTCLTNLSLGQKVSRGELIGKIGNFPINGNWSPHVHFQIIIDLMEEKDNFYGVAEEILFSLWSKISPDPNLILKIPNTFFYKNENISNLIKKRKKFLSNNFSISYLKPLHMLEGKNQYLYDDKGRRYLDCVNNISHVGHCHPSIHEALIQQNAKLNTNTRYLYKIINDYSENLLSKFPKKLDTVFFVCTGSEANDLAYRIARVYTKSKDVLVMNNAYHGHTNKLISLSPYKFNRKGGDGKKEYVHIAEMPDGIRGQWLYSNPNWINKYIQQVKTLIDQINLQNKNLSCFFIESILGCGGQIILPKNYLKEIFKIIRKNNALCIVDEVQTGFGRVGNNFWAFSEHDVVPDIVTLGKPMGNGHPIAAVVTTKEIAKTFNNGMEYFNSFGGNPVSCAVGNAVLKIIKNENLQSHSYNVGKHFLKKLIKIQKKHSNKISEVRGKGLFLGIDLIDEKNYKPDEKLAKKLINHMKNRGILLSTDGPYNNVIKIKPPLPFNKNDSDFVIDELENFFLKFN